MLDLQRLSAALVTFLALVLLPTFCTLTAFFHTYTFQYGWTTSVVLLQGDVPAAVLVAI
jgi:hypothetical protein